MNVRCPNLDRSAFTIPELLVALAIFSMVVIGTVTITVFGMRQEQLTRSKLGMNAQSRKGINTLLNDIRMAREVQIGTGNSSSFTEVEAGQPQSGKAIQITLSTNASDFVRYYLDETTRELRRYVSGAAQPTRIAQFLTNNVIFEATDYTGSNVLTVSPDTLTYNYVVGVNLEFYQFLYPLTTVNTNSHYNYYRLKFKATRHAP